MPSDFSIGQGYEKIKEYFITCSRGEVQIRTKQNISTSVDIKDKIDMGEIDIDSNKAFARKEIRRVLLTWH